MEYNEEYEKEKNSSIKVEKTASGKFVYSVKIYFNNSEDEDAILSRIKNIYDKLKKTYEID